MKIHLPNSAFIGNIDSFMVHIVIWEASAPSGSEPETNWGEHITDEEYNNQPKT